VCALVSLMRQKSIYVETVSYRTAGTCIHTDMRTQTHIHTHRQVNIHCLTHTLTHTGTHTGTQAIFNKHTHLYTPVAEVGVHLAREV